MNKWITTVIFSALLLSASLIFANGDGSKSVDKPSIETLNLNESESIPDSFNSNESIIRDPSENVLPTQSKSPKRESKGDSNFINKDNQLEQNSKCDFWAFLTMEKVTLIFIFVTIIGIFKNDILNCFRRPKLDIEISMQPPDCGEIGIGQPPTNCYYYRFRVLNNGRGVAIGVNVYATKLFKKNSKGNFREINEFIPMELKWSNRDFVYLKGDDPKINIYRNIPIHCNLGFVIFETNALLSACSTFKLDLLVDPQSVAHRLGLGIYRIELKVVASNTKVSKFMLEIDQKGYYGEKHDEMISDGCKIRKII